MPTQNNRLQRPVIAPWRWGVESAWHRAQLRRRERRRLEQLAERARRRQQAPCPLSLPLSA